MKKWGLLEGRKLLTMSRVLSVTGDKMRFLVWGALGVLFVFAAILSVGTLLPAARQGSAERVIRAAPDRVHAAVLDVTRQPEWRPGIQSVVLTEDGWVETTTRGERVTFAIVENTPTRMALRFESSHGYHGTWGGVLTPVVDAGQTVTRLQVTEMAVTPNPLGRVLSRLLFDPEAYSRAYLDALQARVEGGA
jgi:hypothetical protein